MSYIIVFNSLTQYLQKYKMGNAHAQNPCSLTKVPVDFLNEKNQEKLVDYGIVVQTPPSSDNDFTTAKFPDGWTTKHSGQYNVSYYDPKGFQRISVFAKIADYDKHIYSMFVSDDESKEIKERKTNDAIKQTVYETYIKNTFAKEYSTKNPYIVYFFADGYSQAASYMSGYPKNERFWDAVDEFSQHILVGFVNNTKTVEDFMYKTNENNWRMPTNILRMQYLDDGPLNLSRFEHSHLLDVDPNLEDDGDGGTRYNSRMRKKIEGSKPESFNLWDYKKATPLPTPPE
jgi:hypothetical protein